MVVFVKGSSMNDETRSLIAGAVVCMGLAMGSPAWSQPRGEADEERRTPVVLRPNEKAAMLSDMREYLKGLQEIFAALAKGDMTAVATRAQSLGTINIFQTYLMFPTVSGVRFRELSSLVHEDFEAIATDATANRSPNATLEKLSLTMKHCVSCHDSFRLQESVHSR